MDRDFWISSEAWKRDLLAVKRAILDCEPSEAMRIIDELFERLDPDRDNTDERKCFPYVSQAGTLTKK